MADKPNAFSALAINPPDPFPGPMFSGLNAITNPFRSPPSSPLSSRHQAGTAAASGSGSFAQPVLALTAQAAGPLAFAKPSSAAAVSIAPVQTAPESVAPASGNQQMSKAGVAGSSVLANQTSIISAALPAACTLPAADAQATLASSSPPVAAAVAVPPQNNKGNLLSSAPTSSPAAAVVPAQAVQHGSKPAQAPAVTAAAPSAALSAPAAVPAPVAILPAAAAVLPPSATQANLHTPPAASQQTSQPKLQGSQPPVLPAPTNMQSLPAAAAAPIAAAPIAAAVLANVPTAAAAAASNRPASKRKWDVMRQPQPATATHAATPQVGIANAAAASRPTPAVVQTMSATPQARADPLASATNQCSTNAAAVGLVQLPTSLPQQAVQGAVAARQAATLPALESASAAEAAQTAASKALAGKELAAKLAADFAQQHRSKQSLAPSTAALRSHLPVPVDLSATVKAAAAAPAEKVLGSEAARAKATAEKFLHEQALKAKQNVQSSGEMHTARMEALRLRNAAREESPQTPAVLPVAAVPAAIPEPQLAATAALPPQYSELQDLELSQGGSRANKKRGREPQQAAFWELDTAEVLPGPSFDFAAKGSKSQGRTDSPASTGSRDTHRQRKRSAVSPQVWLISPTARR